MKKTIVSPYGCFKRSVFAWFATIALSSSLFGEEGDSEILIRMNQQRKLVLLQAKDSNYKDVIEVVASLAGKRVEIASFPSEPLFVTYRDKTPDEAFSALMRSSVLSVKKSGEIFVISKRK